MHTGVGIAIIKCYNVFTEQLSSKKKSLEEHLRMLEEAKERDHRKLGKELDLFTNSQKVGQGLPLMVAKRCNNPPYH